MKRYDYRRDYKDWTNDEIETHIPILKDKLLESIGYSQSNVDNYMKRISYLENKIKK